MTRPCDLDAVDARKLIGNKKLSPLELTKSCVEQIEKLNPSINAVVTIDKADVVILATPPGFRPQHFEYAVNSSKHVFVEKPVATDISGCLLYTSDAADED